MLSGLENDIAPASWLGDEDLATLLDRVETVAQRAVDDRASCSPTSAIHTSASTSSRLICSALNEA